MKPALTEQQERVYDFIRATIATTGQAPSLTAIAKFCGYVSHTGAVSIVQRLVEKGYVTKGKKWAKWSLSIAGQPGCCPTCGRRLEGVGA